MIRGSNEAILYVDIQLDMATYVYILVMYLHPANPAIATMWIEMCACIHQMHHCME